MAKITKEVTLDNIEQKDIIAMAQYIQQLEQVTKDQKGYILQLQKQLGNAGKKLAQFHKQQHSDNTMIVEASTLELPTLKKN
jgi:thioesterase domain-containing protein